MSDRAHVFVSPHAHTVLLWTCAVAAGLLARNPALALLTGIIFALTLGNPQPVLTAKVQKYLLQASVVGLGFGIKLDVVLTAGATGLGATALSLILTLGLGLALARWLELDRVTGQLISAGTAICGGSAIAVMGPVLGAGERQMSVALITVFVLNAVALFIFPIIGAWAGMDATQFGMWAAMAIHDTSSVAGAAAHYGAAALAVAVAVKLARALWILPLAAGTALVQRRRGKKYIPWFVLGFLVASAAATFIPGGESVAALLAATAKTGLAISLFLIGTALTRAALQNIGWKPLAHAVLLWLTVSVGSFWAIRNFYPSAATQPAAVIFEGSSNLGTKAEP
jgi:uncharacterized integral membrane protein (TIGR00698 family)